MPHDPDFVREDIEVQEAAPEDVAEAESGGAYDRAELVP